MGSTESSGTHLRSRLARTARALFRWLPAALATLVAVASLAVVSATGPVVASPEVPARRPAVPVLSVRRNLAPLTAAAAGRRLRTDLAGFVATQPADTCLTVHAGATRFAHRPLDPQRPASLQKLATAVAALDVLGPDTRLRTEVRTVAPVIDGVVTGDVHLVGGGDPLLSSATYAARFTNQPQRYSDLGLLADAVAGAGIVRIDGAVLGDESRYDTVRYQPAWPPRFVAQDQTGPLSALAVDDGFAEYPARGSKPVTPAADPAANGARVFAELLAERGIGVAGFGAGVAPPEAATVAHLDSPTVGEIVAQMIGESDNNTAELLLKEVGRQVLGDGSFPSGAAGVNAAVREVAPLDGVDFAVADGSGLASENVLTCETVLALLDDDEYGPTLRASLPVAGESGTLRNRWLGTDLVGRVRAKTGTLNQVTALAGEVDGADGAVSTFALIVNVPDDDVIVAETVAAQEQLARILAAHPVAFVVDDLVPDP